VTIEECPYLDFVVVAVEMPGQVLELLAWFAALEADAVDLDLLEAAAEVESASIDPAAPGLESVAEERERDAEVLPGQVAEPWAVWFAEADAFDLDLLVAAAEGWDARVATDQALERSVWSVAVEAGAFDPDRLEAAAETVSVWFVQGAPALVFAA
jgi:hypothetical protein